MTESGGTSFTVPKVDLSTILSKLKSAPLGMTNYHTSEVSTWIPNFSTMELAVHHLYETTMTSRYAASQLRDLLQTAEVKLYYFTIAYFWILRLGRTCGVTDPAQNNFVDYIERTCPLESIPIDGYMKIFFHALAIVEPSNKQFNKVVPYIPPLSRYPLDPKEYLTHRLHLVDHLPGIEQLFRALTRPQIGIGAGQGPTTWFESDLWSLEQATNINTNVGDLTAANRMLRYQNITPGTILRSSRPTNWDVYLAQPTRTIFPMSDNDTMIDDETTLFRMNYTQWFPQTIAKIAILARYWHGSCSLADISPNAHGIGILEIQANPDPDMEDQTEQFLLQEQRSAAIHAKETTATKKDTDLVFEVYKDPTPDDILNNIRGPAYRNPRIFDRPDAIDFIIARERDVPEYVFKLCWMTGLKTPGITQRIYASTQVAFEPCGPQLLAGPYWRLFPIERTSRAYRISDTTDAMRRTLADPQLRIVKPKD